MILFGRKKVRVVDFLRKEFPGKWTYDHKRFAKWASKTHNAVMYCAVADAERDMFQSVLYVYSNDEYGKASSTTASIRQISWGPVFYGD